MDPSCSVIQKKRNENGGNSAAEIPREVDVQPNTGFAAASTVVN
jgi:hypothetical protein